MQRRTKNVTSRDTKIVKKKFATYLILNFLIQCIV